MSYDSNPFSAGNSDGAAPRGEPLAPVPMDIQAILTRCWEIFTGNVGVVIGALLIPAIPSFMIAGIDTAMQLSFTASGTEPSVEYSLLSLAMSLTNGLVSLFFTLGQIRIFLNLGRGEHAEIGMLFGGGQHYLSGLLAAFIMTFATLGGLLLLIVPGIIVAIGLQFTFYALVDQELGPVDAVKESWRLTDGYKGTIFVINFVIAILGLLLSCLTLGLGYFLVVPVLSLTQSVMYQSLKSLRREVGFAA